MKRRDIIGSSKVLALKLKKTPTFYVIIYATIGIFIFFIDQTLKYYTSKGLYINLGIIKIKYITNTGIAFGLFKGFNSLILWTYVFILGLLLAINEFLIAKSRLGFTLIITGWISNFYDRIAFGFVRDYIAIWNFPVFNLADLIVNIGVLLLGISLIRTAFNKA